MKIFLSYSSKDKNIADEIYLILVKNHQVFFDHANVEGGDDFNEKIAEEVKKCELFIFLISPNSVARSSYALTELRFAREKWKHPKGHVLPVLIRETNYNSIPPYLKAITILEPEGSIPAEVRARVENWRQGYINSLPTLTTPLVVGITIFAVLAVLVGAFFVTPQIFITNTNTNTNVNSSVNTANVNAAKEKLFIIKRNSDYLRSTYDKKNNSVILSIPITVENTSSKAQSVKFLAGRIRSIYTSDDNTLELPKEIVFEGSNPNLTKGKFQDTELTTLIATGTNELTFTLQFIYNKMLSQRTNIEFQQQFIIGFKDDNDELYREKIICFTTDTLTETLQPRYETCLE